MEPIVVVIIGMIDETPEGSYLLPHVVIVFGSAMGNGNGLEGRIGARGARDKAIAVGTPRVSNESHLTVVFVVSRIDNAQEFGGCSGGGCCCCCCCW